MQQNHFSFDTRPFCPSNQAKVIVRHLRIEEVDDFCNDVNFGQDHVSRLLRLPLHSLVLPSISGVEEMLSAVLAFTPVHVGCASVFLRGMSKYDPWSCKQYRTAEESEIRLLQREHEAYDFFCVSKKEDASSFGGLSIVAEYSWYSGFCVC